MKILVTDGNIRSALAITRSLGRNGYEVYVASEKFRSLAGFSCFCTKSFRYTDPAKNPDQFRKDIVQIIKKENIKILFPAAETTTLQCMHIKDIIKDQCIVPFNDHESVNCASNKYHVLRLAKKLSVPIPDTFFLESRKDINLVPEFCSRVGFPIVVKSSRSRINIDGGYYSTGVKYANNFNELSDIINHSHLSSFPLLIQKRIVGDGVGLFACYNKGEPVAFFCHRRIREKPPSGGVSVLRESIPVIESLKFQSDKLLRALNWHGVAMVEFKKDDTANLYRLMEINGRFWGSLQLAIDAGVNFPLILAKISEGLHVDPIFHYRVNFKTRWLWGDIDALISRIIKSDQKLSLPHNRLSRWRYFTEFLRFSCKDQKFEVLDLKDPKPWLYETLQRFKIVS